MRGQISGLFSVVNPVSGPTLPSRDGETRKTPGVFGHFIRRLFAAYHRLPTAIAPQKCKLLLHLGNSVSFFVDKAGTLTYDFSVSTLVDKLSARFSSSRVNLWFSPHGFDSKESVS
jgi:hypothetical protein